MTTQAKTKKSGAVVSKVVASAPTVGTIPTGAPTGTSGGSAGTGAGTSTTASPTKPLAGLQLKLQQMLAGVQSMLPAGGMLASAGSSLAVNDIITEIEADLGQYAGIAQQVTGLAQARLSLKGNIPGMKAYLKQLKEALVALYGSGNPALAHFGLAVGKPAKKLTSVQQVVRVAKSDATRKIRNTLGKVQKSALKFQGQVGVSTSVDTPESAASAASGLATAPATGTASATGASAPESASAAPAAAAPTAPSAAGSPPGGSKS
jgi:hypothetical protein